MLGCCLCVRVYTLRCVRVSMHAAFCDTTCTCADVARKNHTFAYTHTHTMCVSHVYTFSLSHTHHVTQSVLVQTLRAKLTDFMILMTDKYEIYDGGGGEEEEEGEGGGSKAISW